MVCINISILSISERKAEDFPSLTGTSPPKKNPKAKSSRKKAHKQSHWNHLMWFIWIQVTFTARYPTTLQSALLKTTKPRNLNYSSPVAQQGSPASARKAASAEGTLNPHLLFSVGTSPQQWGIASTSHGTGPVPPSTPRHYNPATPLTPTPAPASSFRLPQPWVSGFLTLEFQASSPLSILPVTTLLPQPRKTASNCIRWEGATQKKWLSARHSTQLRHSAPAQLQKLLLRSRFCHCRSVGSSNQDAGCRKVRCH